MNIIKKLKDKLKMKNTSCWQQLLIYFMVFGFMFGETYVLIKLSSIANQYSKQLITLEEFTDLQNNVLVFAFIHMFFPFLGMVLMYFWMRSTQEKINEGVEE